jgi:DNA invertase Pin-like site-specific DNA recombinase
MNQFNSIPSPDDPEQALAAVVALRLVADRLERESVKYAIEQGWTWNEIAQALGVTRQAVHKRYAKSIKANAEIKNGGE